MVYADNNVRGNAVKEKIKNTILVVCDDVDFTKLSKIEFYLKQNGKEFPTYTPQVLDAHRMVVIVPYEDAMRLTVTPVRMQFAYLDEEGEPRASEPVTKPVGEFLKEAGYDPI